MSAHQQLTFEMARHTLEIALQAHLEGPLVISWLLMEPKPKQLGYATSIAWPTNSTQSEKLGEIAQKASQLLQNKDYVLGDFKQKLEAQAIEILPKTSHEKMEWLAKWETLSK